MVGIKTDRRICESTLKLFEAEEYKYIGSLTIADEYLYGTEMVIICGYCARVFQKFYAISFSSDAGDDYSDCDIFVRCGNMQQDKRGK